jgi:hypothetical protein
MAISRILSRMIISLGLLLPIDSNELTFWTSAKATDHKLNFTYRLCSLYSEALAKEHCSFSQVGFTTNPCHHGARIVAFISRTKTPIHFSPFSRLSRDSIVSAALSLSSRTVGVTHYSIEGVRTFLPDFVGTITYHVMN